jgi:hypothetical protein
MRNLRPFVSLYKEWTDKALLAGVHVVAASHGEEPEWPAHFASVLEGSIVLNPILSEERSIILRAEWWNSSPPQIATPRPS